MKLIYVEPDVETAREMHARLLEYRAIDWDLFHFTNVEDAIRSCEDVGNFDAALLQLDSTDNATLYCDRLARAITPLPVVAISPENEPESQKPQVSDVIQAGAHSCVSAQIAPRQLMRLVRQAVARAEQPVDKLASPTRKASKAAFERKLSTRVKKSERPAGDQRKRQANPPAVDKVKTALLVEPDTQMSLKLSKALSNDSSLQYEIIVASNLADARSKLSEYPFDVVVAETSLPDCEGVTTLREIVSLAGTALVVGHTFNDDEATCVHAVRIGVEEVLSKVQVSPEQLAIELERIMLREETQRSIRGTNKNRYHFGHLAHSNPRLIHEKRTAPRIEISLPVIAIPSLSNGAADPNNSFAGKTCDLSMGGVSIVTTSETTPLNRTLLVGIEVAKNQHRFAAVEVRTIESQGDETRLGCAFLSDERDPFRDELLRPSLDQGSASLRLPLTFSVLQSWESLGVLQRHAVRTGLVCASCGGLPLLRNGCNSCGSSNVRASRLIHHFACAHVDFENTFEQSNGLACPKCRAGSLIVGADFEYLSGPQQCGDCGWSDNELQTVAECLSCDSVFPIHQAQEVSFFGFHINRLDPLAIIRSS